MNVSSHTQKRRGRFRLCAIVLAVLLGLSAGPAASAAWVGHFSDVQAADWFYDAVAFALENGLTNGTAAGVFSPRATISRAQFVTILGRMQGVRDTESPPSSGYRDVDVSRYYAAHVSWAAQAGLIDTAADLFRPNAGITREEMVLIMGRYLHHLGLTLPDDPAAPAAFADAAHISPQALPYAELLRRCGLVVGDGGGRLNPQSGMTRAEGVTVFVRLYQKLTAAGAALTLGGDRHWFRAAQPAVTLRLDDTQTGLFDYLDPLARTIVADRGYSLTLWSISNRAVLATRGGVLAPQSPGTATISWQCNTGQSEGLVYASVLVTIVPAPTVYPDSISVSIDKPQFAEGETARISAAFSPADATERTLSYKSGNTDIARVSDDGTVTGITAGTTFIRVESPYGGAAELPVTITARPVTPGVPPVIDQAFLIAFNLELARLIGIERANAGLTGIQYAEYMQAGSSTRADEMFSVGSIGHTRPDGRTSRTVFIGVVEHYAQVTECGFGMRTEQSYHDAITPGMIARRAVTGFMNSPAHKEILLTDCPGIVDLAAGITPDWDNAYIYVSVNSYFGNT